MKCLNGCLDQVKKLINHYDDSTVMTTDAMVAADAMVVTQVEFSSEASSSHPGVAPGMRSSSVAGCEDATVLERRIGLDRRRKIRIATWNCGGLSYTTRELCKDLKYDILVLTETQNRAYT